MHPVRNGFAARHAFAWGCYRHVANLDFFARLHGSGAFDGGGKLRAIGRVLGSGPTVTCGMRESTSHVMITTLINTSSLVTMSSSRLSAVDAVTTLLSATARLKRAEASTEPPPRPMPPPPRPLGHSGYPEALAYVRGRDDAAYQREQQERAGAAFDDFARRVAASDDTPPEDPAP